MSARRHFLPVLAVAAGLAAAPALGQSRTEIEAASAAPLLDLSTSPAEAIRAAKAAQTGVKPDPAPAVAQPRPEGTVDPVTVTPERDPKAVVVASTDAAPLSSPRFTDKDAAAPDLAVVVGKNTSLGAQKVDNTHAAGFLKVNPQGGPTRTDVGVTNVFATR